MIDPNIELWDIREVATYLEKGLSTTRHILRKARSDWRMTITPFGTKNSPRYDAKEVAAIKKEYDRRGRIKRMPFTWYDH